MPTNTQQKDIFLTSEADAWFERNRHVIKQRDFNEDSVVQAVTDIAKLPEYTQTNLKILEIGCGEASRLQCLAANLNVDAFGIEPSAKAVEQACARGVKAQCGTADYLPFENASFDIVIFGFCLYLCDRQDLFRIASEADRILKLDAWIVINDFFSPTPIRREYHHRPGIYSYKMDYRTLFDWHPAYTCYSHKLSQHGISEFTDDPQEWVGTSVLRKKSKLDE